MRILVLGRDRAASEGVVAGLRAHGDFESAGIAHGTEEILEILALPRSGVDVVVADAILEADDAFRLARTFRGDASSPRLVVMGLPDAEDEIVRYVEAGVDACLTQESSIEELAMLLLGLLTRDEVPVPPLAAHRLIERIHALSDLLEGMELDISGLSRLTPREKEVLDLLAEPSSNGDIGERLGIAVGTVKSHVHSILRKLGVPTRERARKLLILSRAPPTHERGAVPHTLGRVRSPRASRSAGG